MIISLIIVIICFVLLAIEALYIYIYFKKSITVSCTVISSEKIEEREDGYLINTYWMTTIEFNFENIRKQTKIKTSTCCIPGQKMKCLYLPETNTVFRKRDFKKHLLNLSPVIFSIGNLFLIIEIIISGFNLNIISKVNILKSISIILICVFAIIGAGQIIASIVCIKRSGKHNIELVDCEIADIIRKTTKHKENFNHTYYPVFKYTFHGYEHIVESKLGRSIPPKVGDTVTIPVDKKKGGPVEYKDLGKSIVQGIMFIILSLLIFTLIFLPNI